MSRPVICDSLIKVFNIQQPVVTFRQCVQCIHRFYMKYCYLLFTFAQRSHDDIITLDKISELIESRNIGDHLVVEKQIFYLSLSTVGSIAVVVHWKEV